MMNACILQTDILWGDPQANLHHLDSLLATAPQADLYVLPEMFTTGFATLEGATVEKEPCAGLAWMQRKAAERNAAIAGSIAEAFYGVPAPYEAECRNRLPADMLEVLSSLLICQPTAEMRAALRDLSDRIPRWMNLSTSRVQ